MTVEEKPICLLYHRVGPKLSDPFGLCVSPEHFAEQMSVLARQYNVLPYEQFEACLRRCLFPDRAVLITFDDGYKDNLTTAAPILQAYGLPATFFIVASDPLLETEFWWDAFARALPFFASEEAKRIFEACVSWFEDAPILANLHTRTREAVFIGLYNYLLNQSSPDRLRRLNGFLHDISLARCGGVESSRLGKTDLASLAAVPGMSIGAHSTSHERLKGRPSHDVKADLTSSRLLLESIIGHSISWFAYPYGRYGRDYDDESKELVHATDYTSAFSVACRPYRLNQNRWSIGRFAVCDSTRHGFSLFLETVLASERS
jgi:peptidoglycan/xylan/chitin deacetylase (PgdA/CDA1 family)